MKAVFTAEAIGFGYSLRPRADRPQGGRVMDGTRPWVDELAGLLGSDYQRHPVLYKVDYRGVGRTGNRNVFFCWTLEAGRIYHARYRVAWNDWQERFMTVNDAGEIAVVTEEQVRTWLGNVASA
jgi:hypothetical protein